jgi:hypothetical protein
MMRRAQPTRSMLLVKKKMGHGPRLGAARPSAQSAARRAAGKWLPMHRLLPTSVEVRGS